MDKSNTITSPITQGTVKLLASIPKNTIIESYKAESGIDIDYLFGSIELVNLYECDDTGYRFFLSIWHRRRWPFL
ncbi:MAG: hypothetical protein IPI46_05440 [Bacteroidetes bacterium]|nr:hypothetical protein [Bacteroidota bacterium]